MRDVSLQPKQFRQQTLWPAAAETTHVQGSAQATPMGIAPGDRREDHRGNVEFQTRRSLDNGGQVTSWRSQHGLQADAARSARERGNPAREAELGSGQLPMFMTPREIHARYQPLDGDRHDSYVQADEFDSSGGFAATTGSPERIAHENGFETDDELWDRKLEESQLTRSEYAQRHHMMGLVGMKDGTGTNTFVAENLEPRPSFPQRRLGEDSDALYERQWSYIDPKVDEWRGARDAPLYDRIAEEGVRSPIHLGEDEGVMGKPMVSGGHHRLAAATEIDQDRLMPVLHHRDVWAAQRGEHYPYS